MDKSRSAAKRFAEKFRFSGDYEFLEHLTSFNQFSDRRGYLFSNHELAISRRVTPGLENSINAVCEQLRLPRECFDAFVYPSFEIQASCFAGNSDRCVLRFSSALIDLLDEDEFKFVVGHELAHFLFGHQDAIAGIAGSVELFLLQRAQEISADRIGLLSCGSLDIATRTMMKSLSGLSSKHLRFDVREFIDQGRQFAHQSNDAEIFATHPSIVVRCRGLLWFSATISEGVDLDKFNRSDRDKLDKAIERDLEKYVNGPARVQIEKAKLDVQLWLITERLVENGRFSKRDQALVQETFDSKIASSLKNFLSEIKPDDLRETVCEKLHEARTALSQLIPLSFSKEYSRLEKAANQFFSD